MPKFLTAMLLLLLSIAATAQIDRGKIAYNWVFGTNCGITFNTDNCEPDELLISHYYDYTGGTVSLSDKEGNLLVYGRTPLYNRLFEPIDNSFIASSASGLQTILQIPLPNSINEYLIFSTSGSNLYMSTIDMEMNGGLGGVSELNKEIEEECEETQTATRHANGRDVWLITHKKDCNTFYVYLITPDGLDPDPIVTSIGTSTAGLFPAGHYMKASVDGSLLGFTHNESPEFNLFDFNNSTGEISNLRILDFGNISMGPFQFSQHNRFIYGSLSGAYWGFYQLDLLAGSSQQIVDSKILLSDQYAGDIQYGPDGIVYVATEGENKLWSIKYPELFGLACELNEDAITFSSMGAFVNKGFPQFLQTDLKPTIFSYTEACSDESTQFTTAFPNCIDSVKWCFNDPLQAPYDTSTLLNPTFQFSNSGAYSVQHISYRGSLSDTLYKEVKIVAAPQLFTIEGGGTYCQGSTPHEIMLSGSEVGVSYVLYKDGIETETAFNGTGAALGFGKIAETGEYTIKATQDSGSCDSWMDSSVTVSVSVPPKANSIMHH